MELVGEHIYLRFITCEKTDTEKIVRWRNQEFVRNNFIYREPFTIQLHENWLKHMVDVGKAVQFMIYGKEDEVPIGSVYLKDIDKVHNKAEFGIFIGEEEYLGRGLGREAAKLVLYYGFRELLLHKIFLRVFSYNQPALRSYKKAGFLEEGYFRDEVKIEDQYYDIIIMAVLGNDFK